MNDPSFLSLFGVALVWIDYVSVIVIVTLQSMRLTSRSVTSCHANFRTCLTQSLLFLFMLYCTVMLRKQLVHYWTMGSYIEWVSSFFAILFWFKTKVGATAISFISLNDYTTMIFLSEAAGKSEKPILTRAWWRFQATIHRRLVHHSVLSLIPMSAQAGRRRR